MSSTDLITSLVMVWSVVDPIGTVPVYLSATQGRTLREKRSIARKASLSASGILLFFILLGEPILHAMGIPLMAFQIAGGIILFLFALTMVFGESKPEGEVKAIRSAEDIAIFPIATPSIASPGAIMAVVLLTENSRYTIMEQSMITLLMLLVIGATYIFMLLAEPVIRLIGEGGASVVSRIMGLILASIAATNFLEGIRLYFDIN